MNFYGNYKSPLGYQTGENHIDTYGVDHSGFSTRDELEYQFARQNKENQLIQNYNNQGITKNYPQYGTNFWGGSSNNNYGFGSSNIHDNIENKNNNPFENTVNTFGQNQTEQSYGLGNSNQNQSLSWPQSYRLGSENQARTEANNIPRYWETAADGEKVWNYVQQQEGDVEPKSQNKLGYGVFGALAIRNMINNKDKLAHQPYTDKYKHAIINCKAAQYGEGGYDAANVLSFLKEARDVVTRQNTLDSSFADNYANKIGRLLGTKYNQEKCETLVPRYIDQYYK